MCQPLVTAVGRVRLDKHSVAGDLDCCHHHCRSSLLPSRFRPPRELLIKSGSSLLCWIHSDVTGIRLCTQHTNTNELSTLVVVLLEINLHAVCCTVTKNLQFGHTNHCKNPSTQLSSTTVITLSAVTTLQRTSLRTHLTPSDPRNATKSGFFGCDSPTGISPEIIRMQSCTAQDRDLQQHLLSRILELTTTPSHDHSRSLPQNYVRKLRRNH